MLQTVFKYGNDEKKFTVRAVVYMLTAVIFSIVPYIFLYQIIDLLLKGIKPDVHYTVFRAAAIFFCMAMNACLYIKGLSNSHIAAFNILKNIRISLQHKLENKPLGMIQELGSGNLKKMFVDDIDSIELLLAHALPEGIANIAVPLLLYITIFIIDYRLGLLACVPLPIGIFAIGKMFGVGMGYMNEYYDVRVRMNNTIIEYINGMEVVKVFNKDTDSYKKYKDDILSYRDFTLFWYNLSWTWMALYTTVLPAAALFMLPAGALMIMGNIISGSQLLLALCVSFAVGPPLLKTMNFFGVIPQLSKKITSLEEMMNMNDLKLGENDFQGETFAVDFNNVCFAYKDKEVLHNINIHVKEKSMTALVGESGSGKSTLAKLLVHFYDVNSGSISIGGQNITDMTLEALNKQVSYVAQEQFLFNMSIYDNIKLGKPEASKEEILEAASKAQCMEFLERIDGGIYAMAGEGGKQLSGGERQRISLARAILKDAPVIVLDEATAFIDPENEDKLNTAISEIIKNKTVIVIAHRLSSIQNAGQICVISSGNIIASGTHKELLNDCIEYQKLWLRSDAAKDWGINIKGGEYA